jgi:hypothetical protein
VPFTEYYCDPAAGSNVNGGSSPGAAKYQGTGTWNGSTTITGSGFPGTIVADDVVSVWSGAAPTSPALLGIVSTATATQIVFRAIIGSLASGAVSFNVGGAYLGPTTTVAWPLNTALLKDAAGDPVRINYKGGNTYNLPPSSNTMGSGPTHSGYSSTPGDGAPGGRPIWTGPTTGAVNALLNITASCELTDLILQNNGAPTAGNYSLLLGAAAANIIMRRCTVLNASGPGVNTSGAALLDQCEFYNCSTNGGAYMGAVYSNGPYTHLRRCVVHDNSNSGVGLLVAASGRVVVEGCIFHRNSTAGLYWNAGSGSLICSRCEFVGNGSNGITLNASAAIMVEVGDCNFVNNGTAGIGKGDSQAHTMLFDNCGSYGNTFQTGAGQADISGLASYAAIPYLDAANGDFRIDVGANNPTLTPYKNGSAGFTMGGSYTKSTPAVAERAAAQHVPLV